MKCPVCHIPLIVVEREGIEIDWCLECRGLWFDEGELELLGERAGRALRVADLGQGRASPTSGARRRCPRCPKPMEQLRIEEGSEPVVEIDRCPDHGFWLDQGELGRIMVRLDRTLDSDEGLVLEFLGETFAQGTARPPAEGRRQ